LKNASLLSIFDTTLIRIGCQPESPSLVSAVAVSAVTLPMLPPSRLIQSNLSCSRTPL